MSGEIETRIRALEDRIARAQEIARACVDELRVDDGARHLWVGDPIETFVVNGERYVINGHHRVAAARRAGIDVHYRTLSFDELQAYGYRSPDDVIAAWASRGPDRLRP